MAASLGSLVVSLGLDAAQYVSGLTKAEYQAKRFVENVGKGIGRATAIIGTLATGATAAALAISKTADGIAAYQGLAEKIGDTAVAVSGLQAASDRSGVALETVANLSVKLNTTLANTADQSKGAGAALKAIGINLEEFKNQTPTEQLQTLADTLAGFEEGSAKTAVAVALLGKSGADAIPFLKDLAEVGSQNAKLSAAQIEAADALSKDIAVLKGEFRDAARLLVSDFIPGLSETIRAMKEAYKEGGILKAAIVGIGAAAATALGVTDRQQIKKRVDEIDKELAIARAQLEKGSLKPPEASGRFFSFLVPDIKLGNEALDRIRQTIDSLQAERQKLEEQLNAPPPGSGGGTDTGNPKPTINYDPGAEDAAKQALRRQLELSRVAAESRLALEREGLGAQQSALESYYSAGFIATRDYYAQRYALQQSALAAETKAINAQIAIEQKNRDQARGEGDVDGETKALAAIQRLIGQRAALRAKATTDAVLDSIRLTQEEERYKDQVAEINAQLLELTGNTYAAAAARQALANQDLRRRAEANGDQGALRALDNLDKQVLAQAQFNKLLKDQSDVTSRLSIEEERIQNSLRVGAISELEALNRTGAARKKAADQLQGIEEALRRVAEESKNPALILQAEQARAALEKLRSETELLADKFDTIFRDATSSALADFISGTKSAKDAFLDFTKSVSRAITDLVAQDIAKGIFGGKGPGGGIGGFFANIFGGGSTVSGGVNPGGLDGPLGDSGGGGFFSSIGGFLKGLIPGFAVGTDYVPKDMLAFVHRGERIVPANENKGRWGQGMSVVMNVSTRDAGSFRASRGQLAAQMASTVNAARRNL